LRYTGSMVAPKTAARSVPRTAEQDELVIDALENAPLDPEAFDSDEVAEIEASLAEPRGPGKSSAELLGEIARRAKSEE
jgi:hypothetical protein